jgi:hypothetical protein
LGLSIDLFSNLTASAFSGINLSDMCRFCRLHVNMPEYLVLICALEIKDSAIYDLFNFLPFFPSFLMNAVLIAEQVFA